MSVCGRACASILFPLLSTRVHLSTLNRHEVLGVVNNIIDADISIINKKIVSSSDRRTVRVRRTALFRIVPIPTLQHGGACDNRIRKRRGLRLACVAVCAHSHWRQRACVRGSRRETGAFDSVFRPEAIKMEQTLELDRAVRVRAVRHDDAPMVVRMFPIHTSSFARFRQRKRVSACVCVRSR